MIKTSSLSPKTLQEVDELTVSNTGADECSRYYPAHFLRLIVERNISIHVSQVIACQEIDKETAIPG